MLELLLEAGVAGVVPGVPVVDTIRRVDVDQRSTGLVDRDQLRRHADPPAVRPRGAGAAHRLARRDGIEAIDEAALVELAGHRVQVVPGDPENLKVTRHSTWPSPRPSWPAARRPEGRGAPGSGAA